MSEERYPYPSHEHMRILRLIYKDFADDLEERGDSKKAGIVQFHKKMHDDWKSDRDWGSMISELKKHVSDNTQKEIDKIKDPTKKEDEKFWQEFFDWLHKIVALPHNRVAAPYHPESYDPNTKEY